MKIVISRHPGVCYGVRRAARLIESEFKKEKPRKTVAPGPLYHDSAGMHRLTQRGLTIMEGEDEITGDCLVAFPVFGAANEVMDLVEAKGAAKLNTTCPRASMGHNLAYRLAREGYVVLVVGAPGSPEADVLMSHVRKGWDEKMEGLDHKGRRFPGAVVDSAEEVKSGFRQVPDDVTHVAVLGQINGSVETFQAIVGAAAGRFEEVRAYNTICRSVVVRVQEAARLARTCDAMVVVGDPSQETRVMSDACRKHTQRVVVVSSADEIESEWLEGVETVGVCVATSTSEFALVSVVEALRRHSGAELEQRL